MARGVGGGSDISLISPSTLVRLKPLLICINHLARRFSFDVGSCGRHMYAYHMQLLSHSELLFFRLLAE